MLKKTRVGNPDFGLDNMENSRNFSRAEPLSGRPISSSWIDDSTCWLDRTFLLKTNRHLISSVTGMQIPIDGLITIPQCEHPNFLPAHIEAL